MKALRQLWLQPWRQLPLLAGLAVLIWLAGTILIACAIGGDPHLALAGLGLIALGTWFWHIGLGLVLRSLCRPESFLLPHFRQSLRALAVLDAAQWIGLPALLAGLAGVPHLPLVGAGLLLAAALGVAGGTGRRVNLVIWVVFVAAGWKPQLAAFAAQVAWQAPLTPLLATLMALLMLRLSLRPMLRITDIEPDNSPLESTGLGRMSNMAGTATAPRGALAQRINALFDGSSQKAMARALARYRRRPEASERLGLIRSLLLPHDNPPAIALRVAIVAVMATIYFIVIQHRPHYSAAVIGAYAVLLALTRFPQLGRGMTRMRPNLADLYLTLAPPSNADYQKTLADALLVLVPISVVTALAYTTLGIVLIHAAEPARMLLTTAVVAAGASLVALAVHLIGPESSVGRGLVNIVVVMGAMATYWGGYVLIGRAGFAIGGAVLAALVVSFGAGVWYAAQREYMRRAPRFDAPLR